MTQTLEQAQEANRKLHRRIQELEGKWQRRVNKMRANAEMYRHWYHAEKDYARWMTRSFQVAALTALVLAIVIWH